MRKAIVMLAVVVGLAGLQMNAEARGGKEGGGGGGMGSASQGGARGMQGVGDMTRQQQRTQLRDMSQTGSGAGSRYGVGDRTQQRLQVRDPSLHTTLPAETPAE